MDFKTTLARATEALMAEGFGVLAEINEKETMKKKLDQVSLIDPLVMLGMIASRGLKEVAEEARVRLLRVASALNNNQ